VRVLKTAEIGGCNARLAATMAALGAVTGPVE
jgi:hypothetical protein